MDGYPADALDQNSGRPCVSAVVVAPVWMCCAQRWAVSASTIAQQIGGGTDNDKFSCERRGFLRVYRVAAYLQEPSRPYQCWSMQNHTVSVRTRAQVTGWSALCAEGGGGSFAHLWDAVAPVAGRGFPCPALVVFFFHFSERPRRWVRPRPLRRSCSRRAVGLEVEWAH